MPDQFRYVFRSLSQGRDVNRKYFKTIIKVFAKHPLLYHRRQVPMRGRDQAHINLMRTVAAEPLEFLLLQDAQEFRLKFQRHVANLVKKERPLVRELKAPCFLCDCSRKRSLQNAGLGQVRSVPPWSPATRKLSLATTGMNSRLSVEVTLVCAPQEQIHLFGFANGFLRMFGPHVGWIARLNVFQPGGLFPVCSHNSKLAASQKPTYRGRCGCAKNVVCCSFLILKAGFYSNAPRRVAS
jgi:hypothetical protein